jgi:hypothetical protein
MAKEVYLVCPEECTKVIKSTAKLPDILKLLIRTQKECLTILPVDKKVCDPNCPVQTAITAIENNTISTMPERHVLYQILKPLIEEEITIQGQLEENQV